MKIVDFNGEQLQVCDATVQYLSILFRKLDKEEHAQFIRHAQSMTPCKINPLWHPVIQDYLFQSAIGEEE